ncbi:MAG: hypothetical protein [Caudoviricetes sp.]|nr:MAG: hypothetical protein [Caudoviricetes sp.]
MSDYAADHLVGLKEGDPVIYHRLDEYLECKFIELVFVRGRRVAAVMSLKHGLFLAPPSLVSISYQIKRNL